MRVVLALVAVLAAAVAARAETVEPVVRVCSNSQFGDLGRGWEARAIVAGPLAFVAQRDGYGWARPAPVGQAWPLKLLLVVEPRSVVTLTIGERSRPFAALAYAGLRHEGGTVPLSDGSASFRFEACAKAHAGPRWNRGTQFGGYFLVRGRRCVDVEVQTGSRLLRRQLRFGVPRCAFP